MSKIDALRSQIARALPRRFSLRALMLLIVVSAAGLAYWRSPFEVTATPSSQQQVSYGSANFQPCGFSVRSSNEVVREVRTCRRGWPGEVFQDGLTWSYDDQGNRIVEATWRNGELHGPYRRFDRHGYQYETGQYQHGKRQGTWTTQVGHVSRVTGTATYHEPVVDANARVIALEFDQDKLLREVYRHKPHEAQYRVVENLSTDDFITTVWTRDGRQKLDEVAFHFQRRHGNARGWHPNGQPRYQGQWQDDRAVGKWIVWNEAGQVAEELEFTAGRLQTRAGQPLADYRDLIPFLQQSAQYPASFAESLLLEPLTIPAPKIPSGDPIQDSLAAVPQDVWDPAPYVGPSRQTLTELAHQLIAVIDRSVSSEARTSLPIDFPYHGLPSDAALYLALHPLGLTCEYRYEQLWITTLDAAKTWQRSPAMPQLPPVNPSPWPLLANDDIPALSNTLEYLADFWQRSLGVSIRLGETPAAAEALGAIKVDEFNASISLDSQLATVCELHNLQYSVDGDEITITAREPAEVVASEE